ncbi:hypothetical protein [Legionella gresilensis]|uniref:hypothetical protein n=1 Tax=Legionella gresilensis TaxID=91823 RepID=UPI0010412769|nr:hypothetical protein [Legionella gresilensis]
MHSSVVPKPDLSLYFSGYSALLGIVLVAIGALMSLLAFFKYVKIRKLIRANQFRNTIILDFTLTLIVFLVGLILTIYLIGNRLLS